MDKHNFSAINFWFVASQPIILLHPDMVCRLPEQLRLVNARTVPFTEEEAKT